jgi:hypothetical protein
MRAQTHPSSAALNDSFHLPLPSHFPLAPDLREKRKMSYLEYVPTESFQDGFDQTPTRASPQSARSPEAIGLPSRKRQCVHRLLDVRGWASGRSSVVFTRGRIGGHD